MEKKFKKTCKICKKVVKYDTQDELDEFFYKKQNWYLNTCKVCERAKVTDKYSSGKYNYRKKKNLKDYDDYITTFRIHNSKEILNNY